MAIAKEIFKQIELAAAQQNPTQVEQHAKFLALLQEAVHGGMVDYEPAFHRPQKEREIAPGIIRIGESDLFQINIAGRNMQLPPQETRLLEVLIAHAGEMVPIGELLNMSETKGALCTNISRLRSHIEEDPRHPRLIRSIKGRGYMFNAAVPREA